MAWHKIDQNLPGHPKTMRLRTLRRHKNTDETSGFMLRLWGWALDAKPDGMIGDVPEALAEALHVRDGEELLRHLKDAGFVCTEGCAARGLDPASHRPGRIHDWDKTGGELARQRAEDAERKRLVRAHEHGQHPLADVDGCPKCSPRRKASNGQPTKSPEPSGGQTRTEAARSTVERDEPSGVPQWARTLSSGQDRTSQERPLDASRARTREGDKRERETREDVPPTPALSFGQDASASETLAKADLLVATADEPWASALRSIRQTTSLSNFVTWYGGTRLEGDDTVVCRNAFTREWLEKHYAQVTADALGVTRARFVLDGDLVASGTQAEQARQEEQEPPIPDDDDG